MFYVSTEFRRGVFFVRVRGRIDNEGYLDDIDRIIDSIGIKFVVLNIDHVHDLSIDSIKCINDYNDKLLKKKCFLYLCDSNKNRERVFWLIPKINSEIEAFSLI